MQLDCVDINIIDDNLVEGVESFSVSLTAPNNANGQIILQTSSASVFIADNDGMLLSPISRVIFLHTWSN